MRMWPTTGSTTDEGLGCHGLKFINSLAVSTDCSLSMTESKRDTKADTKTQDFSCWLWLIDYTEALTPTLVESCSPKHMLKS